MNSCEATIEKIKDNLNETNNYLDSNYKIPAPQWFISKRLQQYQAWQKAYEALTKMGLWKEMKIDYMRGNTYIDLYFLTGNCNTGLNADGTVDSGDHAITHVMKNTSDFGPPTDTKEQLSDLYFNKNDTFEFRDIVNRPMADASDDYNIVYDNFIKQRLKEKKFPIFITICSRVLEGALVSEEAMKDLCHTICHEIDAHAKYYVKDDLMKTTTGGEDHKNFYNLSQPQTDSPDYKVIKKLSRAFYFKNII
ncbi:hypothetical protein P1X15_17245 [Runella sp. MFBS21]|uniref:hypothetical protein n=1 Tax=Runella sp. MFBS21 TaxID=3034018 RepID=UPI0023F6ACB3|nr:hypothetical protein [Runella sp. MFBS21]MDF7819367.1 hypothetical protein [Runella sp. MFBS21]